MIEPATEIAPATTSATTPPAATQPTEGSQPNSFAIPEAYKDKGYTKNLKTQDDVWKMLDNAQTLAGKKMVVPDFDKGDPKEIEEYVNNLRPKDKAAYKLSDVVPEEDRGAIIDAIHEAGLPAPIANKLMDKLVALTSGAVNKMYDKDGFMGELKTSFGDDYEKVGGATAKIIAANVNTNDKALLEKMPNQYLALIYRITNSMAKAYGAKETGAGGEGGEGGGSATDKTEAAKELRKQIRELENRNHTAEEKMDLQNQLAALYKK